MKAVHGIVYSDTSGKFGGGVSTKGRFGAVIRMRTKPSQPISNFSASQHARMSTIASTWRTLTESQVAGWNLAAKSFKKSDRLGRSYSPSGFQLFSELNNNLLGIGKAQIAAAPALEAVATMLTVSLAAAAGAGTITLTYTPAVPADESFKIFATPALPVGQKAKESDFRHIGNLVTANATPFDISTLYEAKFGATYTAGSVIYVQVAPVHWSSGQMGIAFQVSAVVAA
jgi:hypothetical protein